MIGALALGTWRFGAAAATPLFRRMLQRRVRRGKEIADRLGERWGADDTPRPDGTLIWLHAASVGEAISVLPVIAALPEAVCVLFTTGTRSSAELLAQHLPRLGRARPVLHRFVPLDVPGWIARFLDHWRPDAAVFVESEIWPNTLRACRARAIPMALINARLSARSAAYWAWGGGAARAIFGSFAFIDAQSADDAARFAALTRGDVASSGNLKRASPPLPEDPALHAALRAALHGRPAWLAASTHDGDDAVIAQAHAAVRAAVPDAVLVIAPRHPERGAGLAQRFGGAPRGSLGAMPGPGDVWIADTLGQMGTLYRACPVVVMGKSFAPGRQGGGQNPLEPARLGCAIACGPAMQNFTEDTKILCDADAMRRTPDAASLAGFVIAMLCDPGAAQAMGARARAIAARDLDLPAQIAAEIMGLLA